MQETNTVEIKKQIEDRTFRRYVLSVNSGQEELVLENLKERVVRQGLQDDVIELFNQYNLRLVKGIHTYLDNCYHHYGKMQL